MSTMIPAHTCDTSNISSHTVHIHYHIWLMQTGLDVLSQIQGSIFFSTGE